MQRAAFHSLLVLGLFGWLFGGEKPQEPRVFAHYMPWFRAEPAPGGQVIWEHWQWYGKGQRHDPNTVLTNGHRDIASVYYPLIGPYDGRDPVVLEYHMLTAKAAGIDGFIADWYGPGTYSDQVFSNMVKAAEKYGMHVGICMEEKAFFPPYAQVATRADVEAEMERHIRHVLTSYGDSPAYLRHGGDPVFLVFNNWGEGPLGSGQLATDEVARVLARITDQHVLLCRTHFDVPYNGIARGNFAWCSFDPKYCGWFYPTVQTARQEGRIDYWLGMANPGFDDSGVCGWGNGPRILDRRGEQEYRERWSDNIKYKPDAVQIVTWNDFEEGTTIEPSEEYGFSFVDLTEKEVRRFTGRSTNIADNRWPWRIYKLRRKAEQIVDLEKRQDWDQRLSAFAHDFSDGERFLMGWRLGGMEDDMASLLKRQISVQASGTNAVATSATNEVQPHGESTP